MKKTLVLILTLVLALGAAQAQNKNQKTQTKSTALGVVPATVASPNNVPKIIKLTDERVGLDMSMHEALKNRVTHRDLHPEELDPAIISSLLWAAYGINRPDDGRRVVPSAVNVQEFDIYLFNAQGVYQYLAKENILKLVTAGDHRAEISAQKHFSEAPISLVIVANYDRMGVFKDTHDRDFYAAVDCGYVSQNIYLYCASAQLGTVACGGINREAIAKILNIKNGRALLAHPVGRF